MPAINVAHALHQTPAHPVPPVNARYNAHHVPALGGDYTQAFHHSTEAVQASGERDYHQYPAHPVLPIDARYNIHHAPALGDYAQALCHSVEAVQASGGGIPPNPCPFCTTH